MTIIVNETAVKVACICCGSEKYATQSPYLCHNCWKNGEAAKLIQQLTQRALDGAECVCENHTDNDGWRCNVCGLLSPHRQ